MTKLVIVESPAKAKTIGQYLGDEYKVIASFGHIMQLPSKDGSVDPEKDFNMSYENIEKSQKHIDVILKEAKKVNEIILATDQDREGEAISWCINELLKKEIKKNDKKISRITFTEITKNAIKDAIKSPRDIDQNLVDAQQARLSLDYLVGFNISPVLWRKLPSSKSAGRVQSVALRIIVDRELEILKFIPKKYWNFDIDLITSNKKTIKTKLYSYNDEKISQEFPENEEKAKKIYNFLESCQDAEVIAKVSKEVKKNPNPPFTTSIMQQVSYMKFGFSAKKTMQVAQKLYEGIEVNGQLKGLITYLRTDGMSISDGALKDIRSYIDSEFEKDYLPEKPTYYKTKAKNSQEAHEAIRPTDIFLTPEKISKFLSKDEFKLYNIIWQNTIACQMSSAIYNRETIEFKIEKNKDKGIAKITGSKIKFDGFLAIYKKNKQKEDDYDKDEEANVDEDDFILPDLAKEERLKIEKNFLIESLTTPPFRFNEASLIKNMESLGIGRPATYSSIISIIQDRGYVRIENKKFIPEHLGIMVSIFLKLFFEKYVAYDFTSKIEEELDFISNGKLNRVEFLKNFWNPFVVNIEEIKKIQNKIIYRTIEKELEFLIFKDSKLCPKCKESDLNLAFGKFGPFVCCINYPKCDYIVNFRNLIEGIGNSENQDSSISKSEIDKQNYSFENDECIYTIKNGRFGTYIERISKDSKEKKNFSLPKNIKEIDDNIILFYSSLPKVIGNYNQNDITVGSGKFGPYILYNKKYYSYKKRSLHEIETEEAIEIIKAKEK